MLKLQLQAYNVHINGSFHCGIRFSDLYQFNEQVSF